ncbi:MAG: rhomboid family intramembrane serine protease [Hyphomicrobiaceae bacterium]|nr:rhomboid family intramembrane serine protease [Hyphomicrobiaceae bacterium]
MQRQPIFNAPGIVVAVIALLIGVHVWLEWLPEASAQWWTLTLGLIPSRFGTEADMLPGGRSAAVTQWLTHAAVHGDASHLLVNLAFLLAFGAALARRIGNARFLALLLLATLAGAAMFVAIRGFSDVLLIGASGAVSGLLGAVFRFMFVALAAGGSRYFAEASRRVPRLSLQGMWREPMPFRAVASWLVLNLVMAFVLPLAGITGGIAWEAHLGGFLFGLLMFRYFDAGFAEIDRMPSNDDFDAPPERIEPTPPHIDPTVH